MLPRPALRAACPLVQTSRPFLARHAFATSRIRRASSKEDPNDPNVTDPGMNGGYPVLPFIKRQHRDPYGDWWDKQERRNFGEPVHEDDDIMGMLTTHDYNHVSPARGFLWFGTFWLVFAAGIGVVYRYYPDKPYVERTFPGGLDKELGGKNALVAPSDGQ